MVKSLNRGLLRSWWCQEEPSDILLHCRWLTLHHRHETVTWNKNTLLIGEQRSEGSLGSRAVLVGCANKTRWGQWFARAFAAWSLSSAPNKTAMLGRLQWGKKNGDYVTFLSRFHCIVCQPARWFLYHATVSCKGPLACGTGVLTSFRVRMGQCCVALHFGIV